MLGVGPQHVIGDEQVRIPQLLRRLGKLSDRSGVGADFSLGKYSSYTHGLLLMLVTLNKILLVADTPIPAFPLEGES
jgi:hypothetical protein